jgi:hypothetical protein
MRLDQERDFRAEHRPAVRLEGLTTPKGKNCTLSLTNDRPVFWEYAS